MSLPLTLVVGYLRAETPEAVAKWHQVLEDYAARAGLLVGDVALETAGAGAATLPAFAGCLEMIRKESARGILLPSWEHLAPNELLGASLLEAAARVDARLYVADQSAIPGWAEGAAASAHQTQADQLAAASRGQS